MIDGRRDEVARGDEPGDVIVSNNGIATMIRKITSVSLSKKHYKKLSIAKFVLNYLICLLIVYYYVSNSIH